jgi:hypothetical protein
MLLPVGCAYVLIPVPVLLPSQKTVAPTSQAAAVTTTQTLRQTITLTTTLPVTQTLALTTTAAPTTAGMMTAVTTTQVMTTQVMTTAVITQPIASKQLAEALALTPANARAIYFTNWTQIKTYKKVAALNSKSPLDQRTAFLFGLDKDQAAPNIYGARAFLRFAETWSWDSTDLAWEVAIDSENAPVHILKFRDDFNFAPVLTRFRERKFTQQTIDSATVYTHEQALTEEWFTVGELSIANTAVITPAKLFVLSSDFAAVKAVLDLYQQKAEALSSDADVHATAAGLGDVAAAIVTPGLSTCRGLSFDAISQQISQTQQISGTQLAELKQKVLGDTQLHPYTGFALGYGYNQGKPSGTVVLHYPSAADAEIDLAPRRSAAEKGVSIANGKPISETLFTVNSAIVADHNLIFELHPANNQPSRLFQMFFYRDMAFAGCP